MSQTIISNKAFETALDFFKSERTAWEIKTIVDKNGKQRKVRIAPAKPEVKSVLQKKKETKSIEDTTLIANALSKDSVVAQKAKAQIYEKYHDDTYRIIYTFIQSNDKIPEVKELAEDLTTDAFVKMYENLEHFSENLESTLSFKSWFTRTASNTARDYLRSLDLKIKENAASQEEMAARMNSASSDKTPYEEMVAEEQARAIREAIDSLPAEYSKPIKLYYFEDNSFDEISKKLGISTTAVSSRIQYARKMLKNKLPKDMFKALILYFESVELLNK